MNKETHKEIVFSYKKEGGSGAGSMGADHLAEVN